MPHALEQRTSLLQALSGANQGPPPIWFMRQAGRYLPEYRALREKYSLHDLFFTPELAAQITRMPLDRFHFDAAILFSDITVVAKMLGFSLFFAEGPKVAPAMTLERVDVLSIDEEALNPIFEAIHLIQSDITVPLLGFCGAPFTVASYLLGGMENTRLWMKHHPDVFFRFLQVIQKATLIYTKKQEEAGVDALQIFDSWANLLTVEEFERFSLPFVKELSESLSIPTLFFMRNGSPYIEKIPCAISLDENGSLLQARQRTKKPLQGNLGPDVLFEPLSIVKQKTTEILEEMRKDPAFIFNLGHGIKPQTPLDAVYCVVDVVKNFL